jgi:hypothetical protein
MVLLSTWLIASSITMVMAVVFSSSRRVLHHLLPISSKAFFCRDRARGSAFPALAFPLQAPPRLLHPWQLRQLRALRLLLPSGCLRWQSDRHSPRSSGDCVHCARFGRRREVRVFTTTSSKTIFEGFEVDLSLSLNLRQVNDILLPLVQGTAIVDGVVQLHIFLPSGLPFLSGTLSDFFKVPAFSQAQRILSVVITRRIADVLLSREFAEVCDASNDDRKLLLSPVVPATGVGYSHIACLLGYLGHDGIKWYPFMKVLATFTGFAPLICGLWRIVDNQAVLGRDIVAVTATLYGFYTSLLPSTLPRGKIFEYVLRTSTFVLHGMSVADQERILLPIQKLPVDRSSPDLAQRYFTMTNQPNDVIVWKVDIDPFRI